MSKDAFGSHYMGEHDSKLRRSGYGHCRFVNGDLYHGLWNKDQMDAFGCYWWVVGDRTRIFVAEPNRTEPN